MEQDYRSQRISMLAWKKTLFTVANEAKALVLIAECSASDSEPSDGLG